MGKRSDSTSSINDGHCSKPVNESDSRAYPLSSKIPVYPQFANWNNHAYAIHLAAALVFLAYEQRSNSEDFAPRLSEGREILDRSEGNPACSSFESAVARMRGFSLYLREPLRRTEGVAINLDPNDPLNWIVLSKVRPGPAE